MCFPACRGAAGSGHRLWTASPCGMWTQVDSATQRRPVSPLSFLPFCLWCSVSTRLSLSWRQSMLDLFLLAGTPSAQAPACPRPELLFPDRAVSAGRERRSPRPCGTRQAWTERYCSFHQARSGAQSCRGEHHADAELAMPRIWKGALQHSEQREQVSNRTQCLRQAECSPRTCKFNYCLYHVTVSLPWMSHVAHGVLVMPHETLKSPDFRIRQTWI